MNSPLTKEEMEETWVKLKSSLDLIVQKIKNNEIKVDMNGHNSGPNWSRMTIDQYAERYLIPVLKEQILWHMYRRQWMIDFIDAIENNKKLKQPIRSQEHDLHRCCKECGEHFKVEFDGKTLKLLTPCAYPNGMSPYSFKINFPSGKMAVANDLREYYPSEPDDEDYDKWDMNHEVGLKNHALFHAQNGWLHFFVSNQECIVSKTKKDCYISNTKKDCYLVGRGGYKIMKDKNGKEIEGYIPPPGNQLAEITTDLWWASIADLEDLKKRLPKKFQTATDKTLTKQLDIHIVDIKPGEYEVTIIPNNVKSIEPGPRIFCEIKKC